MGEANVFFNDPSKYIYICTIVSAKIFDQEKRITLFMNFLEVLKKNEKKHVSGMPNKEMNV